MIVRAIARLAILAGVSARLALAGGPTPAPAEFAWAGALTPTSIVVHAKSSIDSPNVRLRVSENADLSGARVSPAHAAVTAVNNRVVSIPMRGLAANTTYHWAVEIDGDVDLAKQGSFRTPVAGPLTFALGFSSCASTGSNHPVFDTIRAHGPLFFMHMGDLHYSDIGVNDASLYRAAYDTVLASPAQAALYRSAPVAYMWDDHDFGPNNSDATAPGRQAARLTYQEYVPHYPLAAGSGDVPIQQAFSIGRVRFIVADARSERTPYLQPDTPSKTMLGAAQKAWFFQQLLAANGVYPVIVWVNTMPWIGSTGDDGWYAYTYERREIANFIKDHDIRGLFMISGDAHMLAIDDGTNSDYATGGGAGFPVMQAAALDRSGSVKGGPYSEGAYPGGGQFGLMTIEDDGVSPVCVTWSGRNWLDNQVVGWSACASAPSPADTDGDGTGDAADCAFADPGAWAVPVAVSGLAVGRGAGTDVVISWTSQDPAAGPSTAYDLVAGTISDLRASGTFASASCRAPAVATPPYVDATGPPAPGEGEYYLLRAANVCGSTGYGDAGPADPRFSLRGDAPCLLP